jgi:hypothetical protein
MNKRNANSFFLLESHPNYPKYASLLSEGWILGRQVVIKGDMVFMLEVFTFDYVIGQ